MVIEGGGVLAEAGRVELREGEAGVDVAEAAAVLVNRIVEAGMFWVCAAHFVGDADAEEGGGLHVVIDEVERAQAEVGVVCVGYIRVAYMVQLGSDRGEGGGRPDDVDWCDAGREVYHMHVGSFGDEGVAVVVVVF